MTEISPATGKLLALSMLRGIGPSSLRKIAALEGFESLSRAAFAKAFPALSAVFEDDAAWSKALESAERQVDKSAALEARILSALDPEYPTLLRATKDDPFLIWVRGQFHSEPENSVAIIGTREPTAHGTLIAERITQHFVERRWSIVSGLALGCDAIAHQAALDAGGHTVAVLAHGLHTTSPARHRKLADDILAAGGALVSEYPVGMDAMPPQFVKRDRTQAGLAQGVVMVQSDLKGGSLHASRASLEYGRWLAVPYPTDPDRHHGEPKVQANLVIADGTDKEKAELLRCPTQTLRRLHVLRSKEDYSRLVAASIKPNAPTPVQTGLI